MNGFMTFLRNWTLPVAIFVGTVFYLVFAYTPSLDAAGDALLPVFETLLPLSIFCTLFITFSKVDFHLMRLRRWHLYILLTQLLLVALLTALILYIVHCPFLKCQASLWAERSIVHFSLPHVGGLGRGPSFSILLLESILICVIAPCASASPVVTAKLGGDLTQMTTFVLLSSVSMALLIPAVFPLLEPREGITFWVAFLQILRRLATVLLLPLLLGAIVRHWVKPLYQWFVRTPDLGFYCWCVSLSITAGLTVRNIVHSHAGSHLLGDIALLTLATALVQFVIGRLIGRMTGEHICTGQGMFQKNTGLAIWIAYMFLTPEASIGAGCYVLWQNIINSVELWRARHQ